MNFAEIWDLIVSNGLTSLAIAVVAFAAVWLASLGGLLPDGASRRVGVLVSTYLLSGYESGDIEEGITLVVGAVLAAFIHEFKEFIAEKRDQ